VKTFKRDYVRISPIPDEATALAVINSWIDYNTVHLGWATAHPGNTSLSQPVVYPV
jgi:hypothetical protein